MENGKIKSFFSGLNILKSDGNLDVIDNVIKKIIYILVVLIPLWFLPITINVVDFNKQALMVLLTFVAVMLWSVKTLNKGEIRLRSNFLNIVLAIFVVVYILSTVFSIRPYGSLIGWTDHLSGSLINVLCFVALVFLIVNSFKGLKETFGLFVSFMVSSTLVTVFGLLQIFGRFIFPWDFAKVISFNTVGSINMLGIFSATVLILTTAILFVVKRMDIKLFFVFLGLLNLLILIIINFWVLWIVLAVGMIIILLFGLMQIVQLGKGISWVALPIALLAVALIFMFFKIDVPFKSNLPIEVGLNYKSGLSIVAKTLGERPILGSGPETFVYNYLKHKPQDINQTAFWNVRFSNAPAEIYSLASDLGILGLLAFLAVIGIFGYKAVSSLIKQREDSDTLKGFLNIGFFAGWAGLAVAWFIYPQNFVLMFVFWLLFGFYLVEGSSQKERIFSLRKSPTILLTTSFCFIVVIVLIIGLLYIESTRFVAEANYKRGVNLIQGEEDIDKGINIIVKSAVINPYDDNAYKILAQLYLLKLERDVEADQQDLNVIQTDTANAINSVVQATRLSPRDSFNWLLRGQVYRRLISIVEGAAGGAENSYNEALKFEPFNPFIYLELGRLYLDGANLISEKAKTDQEAKKKWNDYNEVALQNFNKAISLKPNYAPAHFYSAVVYNSQGKVNEAIAKMEINRQLLPSDIGTAFQLGVLYYRTEQYNKAKSEFIRAITLDDNFSNARYFLGLIYDREGNKEDAIDQFERIAQLNPDNEQVKQIIENLKSGKPALGSTALGPPKQPENIPIE